MYVKMPFSVCCQRKTLTVILAVFGLSAAGLALTLGLALQHDELLRPRAGNQVPQLHFNKPAGTFKYGDRLTITMDHMAKGDRSFLFSMSDQNTVYAIYPPRDEIQDEPEEASSVTIKRVGNCKMLVDDSEGKLVLVSIKNARHCPIASRDIIHDSDWSQNQGQDFVLKVRGTDFLERLISLQERAPDQLGIQILPAPSSPRPRITSR